MRYYLAMPKLSLIRGYSTLVDDEDFERFGMLRWSVRIALMNRISYPYAVIHIRNPRRGFIHLHRSITGCPDGLVVDHINGDTLDNRRSNLRICTRGENTRNQRLPSDNTSGFKGVSRVGPKWHAQISAGPGERRVHIGNFSTPREAAMAYDAAARKYHGEFARLNFPT